MAIRVEFGSGLGNQLFQFAAAYSLSRRVRQEILADLSSYEYPRSKGGRIIHRPFVLEELGFPMTVRRSHWPFLYRLRGYPRLRRAVVNWGAVRFSSEGDYSSEFDRLPCSTVLSGYFQDLRYFQGVIEEVMTIVRDRLEVACRDSWEPIPKSTGAVHLRFGDYLKHPEFYPGWFAEYAPNVTRSLLDSQGCDRVVIFTDDAVSAASCLKGFGSNVEIATSNPIHQGAADLLRMSSASVLAIANSSFSWWAGMLASQQGRRVIAPALWSTWCDDPEVRLYPTSWTVLQNTGFLGGQDTAK